MTFCLYLYLFRELDIYIKVYFNKKKLVYLNNRFYIVFILKSLLE